MKPPNPARAPRAGTTTTADGTRAVAPVNVVFGTTWDGQRQQPHCSQTDNDFNDLVFEVTVARAVGVQPLAFGAIKSLYR